MIIVHIFGELHTRRQVKWECCNQLHGILLKHYINSSTGKDSTGTRSDNYHPTISSFLSMFCQNGSKGNSDADRQTRSYHRTVEKDPKFSGSV